MQGGFEQQQESPQSFESVYNTILEIYHTRQPLSEFFKFSSFLLPNSADQAYFRCKKNVPKFLFYYLVVAAISLILSVFSKIAVLVPFAVCTGCFYLSSKNYSISGVEITQRRVFYACIGILVLLALISSEIAFSYLLVTAFLAISLGVILTHAAFLSSEETEATESI